MSNPGSRVDSDDDKSPTAKVGVDVVVKEAVQPVADTDPPAQDTEPAEEPED